MRATFVRAAGDLRTREHAALISVPRDDLILVRHRWPTDRWWSVARVEERHARPRGATRGRCSAACARSGPRVILSSPVASSRRQLSMTDADARARLGVGAVGGAARSRSPPNALFVLVARADPAGNVVAACHAVRPLPANRRRQLVVTGFRRPTSSAPGGEVERARTAWPRSVTAARTGIVVLGSTPGRRDACARYRGSPGARRAGGRAQGSGPPRSRGPAPPAPSRSRDGRRRRRDRAGRTDRRRDRPGGAPPAAAGRHDQSAAVRPPPGKDDRSSTARARTPGRSTAGAARRYSKLVCR